MKILLLINNDIHSATALNLLLPELRKNEVRIILSEINSYKDKAPELLAMEEIERDAVKEGFLQKNDLSTFGYILENKQFKTFEQIAKILNCQIKIYDNINSEKSIFDLKEFAPDLALSIRFRQILHEEIIKIPKNGVINLHSGLLPQFRGVLPSFWTILSGEKTLGTTLHFINNRKIDVGDIIGFTTKDVDFNQSLSANINQLYYEGCQLIVNTINKINSNSIIKTTKQDETCARYFSYPQESDVKKFLQIMKLV